MAIFSHSCLNGQGNEALHNPYQWSQTHWHRIEKSLEVYAIIRASVFLNCNRNSVICVSPRSRQDDHLWTKPPTSAAASSGASCGSKYATSSRSRAFGRRKIRVICWRDFGGFGSLLRVIIYLSYVSILCYDAVSLLVFFSRSMHNNFKVVSGQSIVLAPKLLDFCMWLLGKHLNAFWFCMLRGPRKLSTVGIWHWGRLQVVVELCISVLEFGIESCCTLYLTALNQRFWMVFDGMEEGLGSNFWTNY